MAARQVILEETGTGQCQAFSRLGETWVEFKKSKDFFRQKQEFMCLKGIKQKYIIQIINMNDGICKGWRKAWT